MKSLKDLEAIRDRAKQEMSMRETSGKTRIVVGHGHLWHRGRRASGHGRISEELETRGVRTASVSMTGCVGFADTKPCVT